MRSNAASTPGSGQRLPPVPGRVLRLTAAGPGIRDDSGATAGLDIPIFYDPMISKLIAWADRPSAIARMRRARSTNTSSPGSNDRAVFHVAAGAARFVAGQFTPATSTRCSRAERPAVRRSDRFRRGRRGDRGGCRRDSRPNRSGRLPRTAGAAPGGEQRWKMRARTEGLRWSALRGRN